MIFYWKMRFKNLLIYLKGVLFFVMNEFISLNAKLATKLFVMLRKAETEFNYGV